MVLEALRTSAISLKDTAARRAFARSQPQAKRASPLEVQCGLLIAVMDTAIAFADGERF